MMYRQIFSWWRRKTLAEPPRLPDPPPLTPLEQQIRESAAIIIAGIDATLGELSQPSKRLLALKELEGRHPDAARWMLNFAIESAVRDLKLAAREEQTTHG